MYHDTGNMGVSPYRKYGCIMIQEIWVYHDTGDMGVSQYRIWVYHDTGDMGAQTQVVTSSYLRRVM